MVGQLAPLVNTLPSFQPDIILLDINMPEMDGYQTLEAIAQQGLKTNVIVVSGDVQPEAYERVIKLVALDFIRKPVSAPELLAVLSKHKLISAPDEEEPKEF